MSDPGLLKAIGASWRLLFFLLLQIDVTTKSFTSRPQPLADALGVAVSTLSTWLQRLESLEVIAVKTHDDRLKLNLLPPFSKIIIVTEEADDIGQAVEPKKREFDESTTDIILRRRSRALNKVEEDVDFIFNKLLSFDLRLSALERVYQKTHKSPNKNK